METETERTVTVELTPSQAHILATLVAVDLATFEGLLRSDVSAAPLVEEREAILASIDKALRQHLLDLIDEARAELGQR